MTTCVCLIRWQHILILSRSTEPVTSVALEARGNNGNHMSKTSFKTTIQGTQCLTSKTVRLSVTDLTVHYIYIYIHTHTHTHTVMCQGSVTNNNGF
jgi:hypothetical protein